MTKITESRSAHQRDSYRIASLFVRPPRRVWLEIAVLAAAVLLLVEAWR